MREGCSVALMGLLLDTIPDWGLSLRVVFTVRTLHGDGPGARSTRDSRNEACCAGRPNNRSPTIPGVPKSSEPARSRADGPSPVSGDQRKEIDPNAAEWAKHPGRPRPTLRNHFT